MSYAELLHNLGFTVDPFAKTNADEEELLDSYFIQPPFFKAVYGDIATPKSAVVLPPGAEVRRLLNANWNCPASRNRFCA